eukprot:jgi/Mesen1/9238/ME000006S09233
MKQLGTWLYSTESASTSQKIIADQNQYLNLPVTIKTQTYTADSLEQAMAAYPMHGSWTTGLCGCFEDCNVGCMLAGVLWTLLAHVGVACLYSFQHRRRISGKYNLPGSACGDCLLHCCCTCCAISQENRELKNRGWDPVAGYNSSMYAFQAKAQAAPFNQAMHR